MDEIKLLNPAGIRVNPRLTEMLSEDTPCSVTVAADAR